MVQNQIHIQVTTKHLVEMEENLIGAAVAVAIQVIVLLLVQSPELKVLAAAGAMALNKPRIQELEVMVTVLYGSMYDESINI